MTYRELFYKAQRLVDKDEITLGEYEEMTKPLDREIEQEPQTFKWCTTCKEYDQEKHCCHRWSKVIRNTVEELKQEYIEREVLDKIRAEILDNAFSVVNPHNTYEYINVINLDSIGKILDKYKAESNS